MLKSVFNKMQKEREEQPSSQHKDPYREELMKIYLKYCSTIYGILRMCNIDDEFQLFSGCLILPADENRAKVRAAAHFVCEDVWRDLEVEFKKFVDSAKEESDRKQRIASWVNFPKSTREDAYKKVPVVVSFSWVALDMLAEKEGPSPLAKSVIDYWQHIAPNRWEAFNSGLAEQKELAACLKIEVSLVGSRASFLASSESDMDFSISASDNEKPKVKEIIKKPLEQHFGIPEVTNLSPNFGWRAKTKHLVDADIIIGGSGDKKRDLQMKYFQAYPCSLVLVNILLDWARNWSIKNLLNERPSTISVVWLIIEFMKQKIKEFKHFDAAKELDKTGLEFWSDITKKIDKQLPQEAQRIADSALQFFEWCMQLEVGHLFDDPISGREYQISLLSKPPPPENSLTTNQSDTEPKVVLRKSSLCAYQTLILTESVEELVKTSSPNTVFTTRRWFINYRVPNSIKEIWEDIQIHYDNRKKRSTIMATAPPTVIEQLKAFIKSLRTITFAKNRINYVPNSTYWKLDKQDPAQDLVLITFKNFEGVPCKVHSKIDDIKYPTWQPNQDYANYYRSLIKEDFYYRLLQQWQEIYDFKSRYTEHASSIEVKIRFGNLYFLNVDHYHENELQYYKRAVDKNLNDGYSTRLKRDAIFATIQKKMRQDPVAQVDKVRKGGQSGGGEEKKKEKREHIPTPKLRFAQVNRISKESADALKQYLQNNGFQQLKRTIQAHVHLVVAENNLHLRQGEIQVIFEKDWNNEDIWSPAASVVFNPKDIKYICSARICWLNYSVSNQDSRAFRMSVTTHEKPNHPGLHRLQFTVTKGKATTNLIALEGWGSTHMMVKCRVKEKYTFVKGNNIRVVVSKQSEWTMDNDFAFCTEEDKYYDVHLSHPRGTDPTISTTVDLCDWAFRCQDAICSVPNK